MIERSAVDYAKSCPMVGRSHGRHGQEKRQFAPGGGPPCNQVVLGGPDPPPSTVLLVLGGPDHPPGTMRLLLGGLDSPPSAVRLLLGGLGCLVLPSDLQKLT